MCAPSISCSQPWLWCWLTGNLFEGEWREGKPVVKDGNKQSGPMDWLQEAVANVSVNLTGGNTDRGRYRTVSTLEEEDR